MLLDNYKQNKDCYNGMSHRQQTKINRILLSIVVTFASRSSIKQLSRQDKLPTLQQHCSHHKQ